MNWTEYFDTARQTYRAARFVGGQLESCLFISATADLLPAREWLVNLFAQKPCKPLTEPACGDKPLVAGQDKGRTVCACFNVGENTIRTAIAEQGLIAWEPSGGV